MQQNSPVDSAGQSLTALCATLMCLDFTGKKPKRYECGWLVCVHCRQTRGSGRTSYGFLCGRAAAAETKQIK